MKKSICFFFMLASMIVSAQIRYEQGYFIDNQNHRTDCLIRNIEWNDTPSEFEYKLSETDNPTIKKDYEVKEFKVGENMFVSLDIAIDQSADRLDRLSSNKNPEFQTKRIFLKVLVSGTANLYHYGKNDLQRYFYSIADKPIEQLVYKRYYPKHEKLDVATNNYFRQQLWNNVKCDNSSESDLEKLGYNKNDLTRYFENVNLCKGDKVAEVKSTSSKGSFNLKGAVMFGQHGFSIDNPHLFSHDFEKKSYVTFGIEGEYILPIWNNKWGLILEPSFNSYKQEDTSGDRSYAMEFKYFMLSAGVRHYFFISDESKIFINVSFDYLEIAGSSKIKYIDGLLDYPQYDLSENSLSLSFGAGYNYKRLYVELRYHQTANPTPYEGIDYKYNNLALIGRYKFL